MKAEAQGQVKLASKATEDSVDFSERSRKPMEGFEQGNDVVLHISLNKLYRPRVEEEGDQL